MKLTLNIVPIPGMDIDLSVQPGDKGEGCAISLTMKASTEAATTSPLSVTIDETAAEPEAIEAEENQEDEPATEIEALTKPKTRRITKKNSPAVRAETPKAEEPVQDAAQPEVIPEASPAEDTTEIITEAQAEVARVTGISEAMLNEPQEEASTEEPPVADTPAAKLSGIFKKPAQAPVPQALEETNISSIVSDLEAADQAPSDPEDEPEEEPAVQKEEEKPKLGGIFVKRKPSVIDAIEEESAPTEEEEQAPPPPRKPFSPFSKNRNA